MVYYYCYDSVEWEDALGNDKAMGMEISYILFKKCSNLNETHLPQEAYIVKEHHKKFHLEMINTGPRTSISNLSILVCPRLRYPIVLSIADSARRAAFKASRADRTIRRSGPVFSQSGGFSLFKEISWWSCSQGTFGGIISSYETQSPSKSNWVQGGWAQNHSEATRLQNAVGIGQQLQQSHCQGTYTYTWLT